MNTYKSCIKVRLKFWVRTYWSPCKYPNIRLSYTFHTIFTTNAKRGISCRDGVPDSLLSEVPLYSDGISRVLLRNSLNEHIWIYWRLHSIVHTVGNEMFMNELIELEWTEHKSFIGFTLNNWTNANGYRTAYERTDEWMDISHGGRCLELLPRNERSGSFHLLVQHFIK